MARKTQQRTLRQPDITRNNPAERAKFEALCQKYKDRKDVIICDSMPSIEFWFLLHYLNTNRYFATSDDVIDVLHKYIPDFSKQEKFLSRENGWQTYWQATALKQPSNVPRHLERRVSHTATSPRLLRSLKTSTFIFYAECSNFATFVAKLRKNREPPPICRYFISAIPKLFS